MKTLLFKELELVSSKILELVKGIETSNDPFAFAVVLELVDQQKAILDLARHYV